MSVSDVISERFTFTGTAVLSPVPPVTINALVPISVTVHVNGQEHVCVIESVFIVSAFAKVRLCGLTTITRVTVDVDVSAQLDKPKAKRIARRKKIFILSFKSFVKG